MDSRGSRGKPSSKLAGRLDEPGSNDIVQQALAGD
jgi:hypothetical protein